MTQQSSYGFCPECGAPGVTRERRPNGNDTCTNGHTYPSADATLLPKPAVCPKPLLPEPGTRFYAVGTVARSEFGRPVLDIEGDVSGQVFTVSPLAQLPVGQIVKIEITV